MTHSEFRLTVSKNILENTGRDFLTIQHKVGDIVILEEATFNDLVKGNTITRYTSEGLVKFDKYNFENEVEVIQVTINKSSRKLGQHQNKLEKEVGA